ncbi:DUF3574 domain-containing protein, partial [Ralstonia pseudosolanacearum]|uniref:DUF3574 domain-containing protein n=1 Tax=Ralstonia pseudosolanacearum TaxID=1310165 RepID=UPI003D181C55
MAINFENIATYNLYVGLNDKDKYIQIIDDDFAMQTVKDIVTNIVGGATFTKSFGHWVDELGNETNETSIVIEIVGTDDEHIERICAKLKVALNQNC